MIKGLIILSHDCEDVEALATIGLLRRAGFDITSATFDKSKSITTKFKQTVQTDANAYELNPDDFDFLVLPGGPYVANNLGNTHALDEVIKSFYQRDKLIAAICAAPRFLGRLGLLENKVFTGFTGADQEVKKGAYHPEAKVIEDGQMITARGAGVVYAFVYQIIKHYHGLEKAEALLQNILH